MTAGERRTAERLVKKFQVNNESVKDKKAHMTILYLHHCEMDMCADFPSKRKLPHQLRRNTSSVLDPAHDSIKVNAARQQRAGVPSCGTDRQRAHTRRGRRRARGSAAVLRGGYAGEAAVGG